MGENTRIEWAHHTFNPWIGCTPVSPACDYCYAEAYAKRFGLVEWGPKGERKRTSESNWKKPLGWNGRAKHMGERHRVFCASLADVFDNAVPAQWRRDLFALINMTPHLDWLLLTKRPQNIPRMMSGAILPTPSWSWPNVWLGTTVENQEEADRRIPYLLGVPAAVHFLSCEPLLGPVDLTPDTEIGPLSWLEHHNIMDDTPTNRIGWVIAGGESGPNARPMHPDWARSLRDQCAAAGVAFFFKQWGEWGPCERAQPHDAGEHLFPGGTSMLRIGKKAAGRELDGRVHDEFPEGR